MRFTHPLGQPELSYGLLPDPLSSEPKPLSNQSAFEPLQWKRPGNFVGVD